MDSTVVKMGLDLSRIKKKWIFLFAAFGFTGYGAYRVYNLPSMVKKRRRLMKLFGALISVAEMVSDSAEAIGVISKDMKEFLQSDSDQIPNSLKQISKIANSDEFSETLVRITRALTIGVLRAYKSQYRVERKIQENSTSGFSDRVMDKLFSTAGSGFASVVVGSFARNLAMGFYSENEVKQFDSESEGSLPKWVHAFCNEKGRRLVGDCIQLFVSTAVAVYLDKTMHINFYDELFAGLTNPKHETKVRDMLVFVCNAAVETLVNTSHGVMTGPNQNPNSGGGQHLISLRKERHVGQEGFGARMRFWKSLEDQNGNQFGGWIKKMSSTLTVPSNRKLVLDVTSRITFETVRSFLEVLMEKFTEFLRMSVDVAHEVFIDRGLEAVRYVTVRSSVVATVCLSLCLHILDSAWIFVPAGICWESP
ncbi:hypothetical protein RJ641_011472 [Dillenia turbinata]|uniref:Protein PHLOEM PROTEIN 2-LIKE A10 n=1 Tax=Dillenia turbinata TaxID=194707 RepID=A0AAN8UU12_9MAGN